MTETAIVVAVPEAAPAIDSIRRVHTSGGLDGIPAHVTLLYPFMARELLSEAVVDKAGNALAPFPPFDVSLAELRWFDASPAVLYLAPVPAEPFVRMVGALAETFPDYPPYGGAHAGVIPHLTVAEGEPRELAAFERQVAGRLPITARVAEAGLYRRDARGHWQLFTRLPFEGRA